MVKEEKVKKPSRQTIKKKNELKKDNSSLPASRKKLKSIVQHDLVVPRKGNKKYKPSNKLRQAIRPIKLHEKVIDVVPFQDKGKIKLKITVGGFGEKPFYLIFECETEDQLIEVTGCASKTIDRKTKK